MATITSVEQLLFPIAQERLCAERAPASEGAPALRPIAYKAVVNARSGDVLGVVRSTDRIVSHEQALALGRRCAARLFGSEDLAPLQVLNVEAPASGAWCCIDLVHEARVLNVSPVTERAELYMPFVRVHNAYDGSLPLAFDVGFCRRIGANGVVFETDRIPYRLAPGGEACADDARFECGAGYLERVAARFRALVAQARALPLGEEESRAIVRRVLGVVGERGVSETREPRVRLQLLRILNATNQAVGRYRDEHGPNAYAVFGALTDIASHFGAEPGLGRATHPLQVRAGRWLVNYCRANTAARRAAA